MLTRFTCVDAWIARDLHNILADHTFSVYCYEYHANYAHGLLRKELRNIYLDSEINVVLWSATYRDQPTDSIVAMERRCISHRHVEKDDAKALAILLIDETRLERDLEEILGHSLSMVGVFGFARFLIEKLSVARSKRQQAYDVFHPDRTETVRGRLLPCTFQINRSYEFDPLRRWETFADVLVNCPTTLGTPYVYLIPSGGCSPLLRHSVFLKNDAELLEKKRRFTTAYVSGNWAVTCLVFGFLCALKIPCSQRSQLCTPRNTISFLILPLKNHWSKELLDCTQLSKTNFQIVIDQIIYRTSGEF